jgi:pimeloyl-ACP methyl ester carboxylesterase
MFNQSICFFLVVFLAACGARNENSSSTLQSSDTGKRNLVLVMGGFNSCDGNTMPYGMDMNSKGYTVLNILEKSVYKTEYVFSCFIDATDKPSLRWYNKQGDQSRDVKAGRINQYLDYVKNTYNSHRYNVAIIGHSYGGHLAMLTAEMMLDQTRFNLGALSTIDPISTKLCGGRMVSQFCAKNPLTPLISARNRINQQIRSNGGEWNNFYQRNNYPMSQKFKPARNYKKNETHTSIDTVNSVWAKNREMVLRDFFLGTLDAREGNKIKKLKELAQTYRKAAADLNVPFSDPDEAREIEIAQLRLIAKAEALEKEARSIEKDLIE